MPNHDSHEDRLYRDPALAQFYDLDNGWGEDLAYCLGLAQNVRSILDLGCGTGAFAARVAPGRRVVGADPAGAMLDIARKRPGGDAVQWIEADARSLRLEERFDLVLLTGHAFQVFLDEGEQRAVLQTIARQLAPDGRFIFDSRNPAVEEWREWTPELSRRAFEHPEFGKIEAWNEAVLDETSGVVTYWTYYEVAENGQRFSAKSHIRFTAKETLVALISEAGLIVDRWLGDWQGGAYAADRPEIIPVGHLFQRPL